MRKAIQRFVNHKSPDVDLIVSPWGFGGTDNLAQEGAYALLAEDELVKRLAALGLIVREIHPPSLGPFEIQEEPQRVRNLEAILTVNQWLSKQMQDSFSSNRLPIVLGGDGSLCLGAIASMVEHYGRDKVGVIWFSNHLCNSSPRVTQSWNANRMIFTVLSFEQEARHPDFIALMNFRNLVTPILNWDQFVRIGINHKSAQEVENTKPNFFTMEDIDEMGIRTVIQAAIEKLSHLEKIQIIWDLNALDLSGVSNYSLGQINYREALTVARELDLALRRQDRLAGITVVEHCPSREAWDKRGETAQWTMDILTNMFGENIFNAARKY